MPAQITQQVTASTTNCSPTPLTTLRAQLTALTFHSLYLSEAERLRANRRIRNCQNPARFARWLRNLPAVLARHEAEQRAATLAHYATLLHKTRPSRPARPLAYPGDCLASARDQRAAARFAPAQTLRYAHLLLAH